MLLQGVMSWCNFNHKQGLILIAGKILWHLKLVRNKAHAWNQNFGSILDKEIKISAIIETTWHIGILTVCVVNPPMVMHMHIVQEVWGGNVYTMSGSNYLKLSSRYVIHKCSHVQLYGSRWKTNDYYIRWNRTIGYPMAIAWRPWDSNSMYRKSLLCRISSNVDTKVLFIKM